LPGNHDHGNAGMTLPGMDRNLDAIDRTGHLDVGEQQVKAVRTVNQLDGLSAVLRLGHLESLIVQHLRCHEADQGFVLDKQHPKRSHGRHHRKLHDAWPSRSPERLLLPM
jgi:hypothetical protein